VDALAAIRSAHFDLPLSYDAGDLDLRVGDVLRVPLGSREHIAFVISAPKQINSERPLRRADAIIGVPRAFDEVGLSLARFVSEQYLCTLGEALSAVVLSGAVPRAIDRFVRTVAEPSRARYPSVPSRLVSLIWSELRDGFTLEQLLRHPDARRAGDRSALMRYVNTLVRSGELRRERRFMDPRTREYRVRLLFPGNEAIRGPKARALIEFVRAQPGVPRADALLAGFSSAMISRAVKAGAVREEEVARARASTRGQFGPPAFSAMDEQQRAIDVLRRLLERATFAEALLYGITGSGKTFVYIETIKHVLRDGGAAIVLVPEISLTPQTARRFEEAFGERVAVLHSGLSERERFDAWQACAAGAVDVVVGARSAVFAPLTNVRLIIIDESHETSYKQDTSPRYHAVPVARERMRIEGGVLVSGSATPSLESYADALANRTHLLELKRRATHQPLPAVQIIDMAQEFEAGNRRVFSSALVQALDDRFRLGEKAVLFVNRRGSAAFLLCRNCGSVPECRRCSVSLTAHRAEGLLRCHYCDLQRSIPVTCETCGAESIREFGIGTERVVQEVIRLYPKARVVRMDSDTTTRVGDHARLLDEFASDGDVLVGTQMVAKGLDFPSVTLVGVVAADIGLHAADFRASERSFALLTQVCGRSGRARPGEAIIQTYSPAHAAIQHAARHDYAGFARIELAERAQLHYPPSHELMYVGVIGRDRAKTLVQADRYADVLRRLSIGEVLGPAPYPIARLGGEWRFRIALKGPHLAAMQEAVRTHILPMARSERESRVAVVVHP
jgi:primosomal protein N' (replication factor Y) (superfamily II helicase)